MFGGEIEVLLGYGCSVEFPSSVPSGGWVVTSDGDRNANTSGPILILRAIQRMNKQLIKRDIHRIGVKRRPVQERREYKFRS